MEREELLKHLGSSHRLATIMSAEMDFTEFNDLRGASTAQVTGQVTEYPAKSLWVSQDHTDRAQRLGPTDMAVGYLNRLTPNMPVNPRHTELAIQFKQTCPKKFIT